MSVLQKVRLIAGERLDIPDISRIQEFACSDWGQFFNKFWSDSPYIIKGFEIDSPRSYIGLLASQGIQIEVANSVMFYGNATYGGAFYVAPATTTPQAVSLTTSATNYVEFEFTVSTGTPDTRKIWDADIHEEFNQIIDTVQYLDIIVTSNTIGFTTGRIPIAKVVTNASAITFITDCRDLFFRLGTGGAVPNQYNLFTWPDVPVGFSREDEPVTISSASTATANPFKGSDKNIRNLKEWMDAVMSRIKEISGDAFWFRFMSGSGGGGRGANVADLWWDSIGSKITGTGTFAHTAGGILTWNSAIFVQGIVGPYYFKIPASNITLADDKVAYLLQFRNQPTPANFPLNFYNGLGYVNSNGGLIGDFIGLAVGDFIKNTTDGIDYYARITAFSDTLDGVGPYNTNATALSVVISPLYKGATAFGALAVYSKGTYVVPTDVIVASRDSMPNNSNIWWLAIREDNTGGNPLIYIRDGSELKEGESIEIGDETSEELLSYIGAPDEATAVPTRVDAAALVGSKVAVQNYSCVATDNLTVRDSKLTSMMADKAQDKTISIREGGLFTWDLATSTLSWTEPIVISIPSSTFNETIAAASQVLAAGECIYFTIDRNAVAVDIRAISVALEAAVPLNEYTFVLAKRGSDNNIYLMDGTVCEDDSPTGLGGMSIWQRVAGYITPITPTDGVGADYLILTDDAIIGTDVTAGGIGTFAGHLYTGQNLYIGNWMHLDTPATGSGVIAADDGIEMVLDQSDAYANSIFSIRSGSLDSKDSLGNKIFEYGWSLPYDIWSIDETGLQKNYGDIIVGTPAGYAVGTLTFTGLPSLAETFTVNAQAHTIVALAAGANQITLSVVSAAEQGDFVARDFNLWSAQKANCFAVSDGLGSVKFIWKTAGIIGNTINFLDGLTNATMDGTNLLGGTVAGFNEAIQLTVDGSTGDLTTDGSTIVAGAQTVGRTNASLAMAIATANALRTVLLAHYSDGAGHFNGGFASPDTPQFNALTAISVASNLATLITLVTGEQTTYTAHDTDAKLALPVYHNAQYAGSNLILGAPGTLATCIAALDEIIVKYSTALTSHDLDVAAHTPACTHPITTALLYSYSSTPTDYIIGIYDTSKVVDVVLSTADCVDGRTIIVKDFSGGATAMNITVSTEGGELIDGLANQPIAADWNSFTLVADGTSWGLI